MTAISGKKAKSAVKSFLFGGIIGSSMLIPGVSGGTMAIILGIYDRLITAVSRIFKEPKQSLVFLGVTAAGGVMGILLFSRLMLLVVEQYPVFSMFFFIGAILGGIPMLVKKSGIMQEKPWYMLFALAGIGALFLMRLLPEGNSMESSPIMLMCCGIIIAAALVLPGISTSHILLILGMYEIVWGGLQNAELSFGIFLGIGMLIGVFLTAKLTEHAMKQYPCQTYMVMIGFVMTSVYDIFPKNFQWEYLPVGLLLLAGGFALVFRVSSLA